MIRKLLIPIRNYILLLKRKVYLKRLQRCLPMDNISIISTNCFAGRLYQDFNLPYLSPTAGLYFIYHDYIDFLKNLKVNLSKPVHFIEESGNKEWKEHKDNDNNHLIGLIEGTSIEVHFLHYPTKEDAIEKWTRRSSRVNFDNLLIIGMDQNLCSEEDIREFDKLPYKNKIFFSSKDISGDSVVYIKEFAKDKQVGNPHLKGHVFYKYMTKYFEK